MPENTYRAQALDRVRGVFAEIDLMQKHIVFKTKNIPNLVGTIVLLMGIILFVISALLSVWNVFPQRLSFEENSYGAVRKYIVFPTMFLVVVIFPLIMTCGFSLLWLYKITPTISEMKKWSFILSLTTTIFGIICYYSFFIRPTPFLLITYTSLAVYATFVLGIAVMLFEMRSLIFNRDRKENQ